MPEQEIVYDGPVPVYRQVAAYLRVQITTGKLKKDQRVPSESTICQEFGVSRATARKAVSVLRDEDLVQTIPQRGTFVK